MAHKKNGKSKANQTTTWQQKNDANNVSATVKLAGKAEVAAAEAPENSRNHTASEVIIQQQQVTIDELLARIVKLEERVIVLEGGLASASHVTYVLQEQLTARTNELEMYSRRSCVVLTGLCKEENKNFNKLKEDDLETLCETGISKEEISNNIDKLHRIGKTNKNNIQNTIVKFKSHSFNEKIYFKRKAVKDVKIKPSLTKHRTELLKNINTLVTDNPGTNFLFRYADVHGNLKIRLKDARNGREVVRFDNEKDFNQLFAKSF